MTTPCPAHTRCPNPIRALSLTLAISALSQAGLAQVTTRAICSHTWYSRPSCWSTGTVPINEPGLNYNILDPTTNLTVEVDVPSTIGAINAPEYRFDIRQDFIALGPVNVFSVQLQRGVVAQLGTTEAPSTFTNMNIHPNSTIELNASTLTLSTITLSTDSESDTTALTINAPVIRTDLNVRIRAFGKGINSVQLPSTHTINPDHPDAQVRLEGYVEAPVLENVPEGQFVVDNDPNSLLNAPVLRSVSRAALVYGPSPTPLALKAPPITVNGPMSVFTDDTHGTDLHRSDRTGRGHHVRGPCSGACKHAESAHRGIHRSARPSLPVLCGKARALRGREVRRLSRHAPPLCDHAAG